MKACLYCGESDKKFCKAHILPESLGAFKNQPTLLNKVCAECDTEIGKFEDQFTHTGLAALLRPVIGLSLDGIYNSMKNLYCSNCKDLAPRPDDWKWTRSWQNAEAEKEIHKKFLAKRNSL